MSPEEAEEAEDGYEDIPEPMRGALLRQRQRPRAKARRMAADIAELYRGASDDLRAKLATFFTADGPELMRQIRARHAEGIPTSGDLERWASA